MKQLIAMNMLLNKERINSVDEGLITLSPGKKPFVICCWLCALCIDEILHPKNLTIPVFVKVLKSFCKVKDDEAKKTYLQLTDIWIDCTKKGGLFLVSDECYVFFRSIENCVRTVLKKD